ncbi:porin [Thiomonas sp. FB-Cd]|uniref:porin n=1 Tax=Thiomonas sp. FB-Cd TaxID=1158292 RepID=UPI0004DF42AA|nr:porin [Thiomonas sp. FB-Cd]
MRRKTAALGAILISTGCMGAAKAQNSVQLYGVVDLGLEHLSFDHTAVSRLGSGVQAGSRIGFKGREDLGSGISAGFQVESGFCANGTNGAVYTGEAPAAGSYCTGGMFMGRTSALMLDGSFGHVQMGRIYSDYLNNAADADPFGAGLTGAITNIDPGVNDYVRISQALQYTTPSFGGFRALALYGFGGYPGSLSKGRAINVALKYSKGHLNTAIGYFSVNSMGSASTASFGLDATGRAFAPNGGIVKNRFLQAYLSYDAGVATVAGYVAKERFGRGATMADGSASPDVMVYMLGATIPVGAGNILMSYSQHKDKNMSESTSRQLAIGYTYTLSKSTDIYFSYADIRNDRNVDQYVGDATVSGAGSLGGQNSSGIALGLKKSF